MADGINSRVRTQATSVVYASVAALHAADAIKGSGSTHTNAYGLLVDNITTGATNYAIKTGTGSVSLGDKVTTYNAIATAGMGLPVIVAQANITGQTAAATITSYANPATDADFEISCQLNVSAATSLSAPFQCTYTDVNNVAKTLTFAVQDVDGTGGTYLVNGLMVAAAAKTFMTPVMHIRVKASTTITLKTGTGTYTGVTYSASGLIRKLD